MEDSRPTSYTVSGGRATIGTQPYLKVIDEQKGAIWAFIPYSDRTPQAHIESHQDAQACCDGLNAAARAREVNEDGR